jgi:hypothetical protein
MPMKKITFNAPPNHKSFLDNASRIESVNQTYGLECVYEDF